jgi:D-psicose/D-tagatose/L-ribulose 3-epimerase
MRIGINLLAWSGTVGPEERALFPALAQLGYSGVELPVFDPGALDDVALRTALETAGLACTVSSALPSGASLLDPAERPAGVRFLQDCIRVSAALGATILCGPLYSPVGQLTGKPRSEEEWANCVAGLRDVGRAAADAGVVVALEPLNRFETYFLNTAADARRLVEEVGSDFVGIHLDTFHMHIEEKDPAAAIVHSGPLLRHVHFSENDRGIPGTGQVPWSRVTAALAEAGYQGWIVFETFSNRVEALAAATAIWRPLVPDPMTYARESLRFARSLLR